MNDADLPSINLEELRLVPDWLRENTPAPSKQYASYDRPLESDSRDRRGPQSRGGPGSRDRRDGRDNRGARDRRDDRPGSGAGPRGRESRPAFVPREPQPPPAAAPIRVEFLPDERCMTSIIKQIRTTHMAYPLFSLARMFLQEPARHYLQLSIVPGASAQTATLFQLGEDGPVALERATLEKVAYDTLKDRFYQEESVQKDPPKGNFTNVARERNTGTLLGPTNYHGYQPALRALYESRFSRRMPFEEYRRNIEVSSDPALVERWKEEARTATTIRTVDGEPPTVFQSATDARTHFRQHHLDAQIHTGMSFRLHGSVARRLPEAAIMQAIREAHERELRYPAQFVQLLRQGLQNAGLHIFKHRKRIVYVAASRPTPFVPGRGAVTEMVSLILQTIAESPLCTRKVLAARVLSNRSTGGHQAPSEAAVAEQPLAVAAAPESPILETVTDALAPASASEPSSDAQPAEASTPDAALSLPPVQTVPDEAAKAKAALAADLRFLVQAGHIIEFHNGTFDLPLTPKKDESGKPPKTSSPTEPDDTSGIGSDPAEVQETAPPAVRSEVEEPDATSSGIVEPEAHSPVGLASETEPATESTESISEPHPPSDLEAHAGIEPVSEVPGHGPSLEEPE